MMFDSTRQSMGVEQHVSDLLSLLKLGIQVINPQIVGPFLSRGVAAFHTFREQIVAWIISRLWYRLTLRLRMIENSFKDNLVTLMQEWRPGTDDIINDDEITMANFPLSLLTRCGLAPKAGTSSFQMNKETAPLWIRTIAKIVEDLQEDARHRDAKRAANDLTYLLVILKQKPIQNLFKQPSLGKRLRPRPMAAGALVLSLSCVYILIDLRH